MGNVFYALLQEKWPFQELDERNGTDAVRREIVRGRRPELDAAIKNSDDGATKAMMEAMRMCWVHDWRRRASAKEVRDYLLAVLDRIHAA